MILGPIGMCIFFIGAAMMDSDVLTIPAALMIVGSLMVFVGVKRYEKIYGPIDGSAYGERVHDCTSKRR